MLNIIRHSGKATKNHNEILTPAKLPIIRKRKIASVGKDVGKLEPLNIGSGNVK